MTLYQNTDRRSFLAQALAGSAVTAVLTIPEPAPAQRTAGGGQLAVDWVEASVGPYLRTGGTADIDRRAGAFECFVARNGETQALLWRPALAEGNNHGKVRI